MRSSSNQQTNNQNANPGNIPLVRLNISMEERYQRLIQAASIGSMEEGLLFGLTDDEKTELLIADNSIALRWAIRRGHYNVVNSLINAAIGLTDQDGQNVLARMLTANNYDVLRLAARNSHDNIVNSLTEAARGLTIRDQDGNDQNVLARMLTADNSDALVWAAMLGRDNVVNSLLMLQES